MPFQSLTHFCVNDSFETFSLILGNKEIFYQNYKKSSSSCDLPTEDLYFLISRVLSEPSFWTTAKEMPLLIRKAVSPL